MPSIRSTLEKYDLDLLLRIARAWDVEINERDVQSARADLSSKLVDKDQFIILISGLEEPVNQAWQALAERGGRLTWSEFSRANGEIRDLGAAARERENPDQNPVSIAESLWYCGLIGRAFLSGKNGLVEYAFIPDELMEFCEKPGSARPKLSLRPAVNQSPRFITRADNAFLDQLTDLLAANRMKRELPETVFSAWGKPRDFMQKLLLSAGLIDKDHEPKVEALKKYFSMNRDEVIFQLFEAWRSSHAINELRMLPGLVCEGNWVNDPLNPRKLIIDLLGTIEPGTWWSISSLLSTIKEVNPDFQRTSGDYDAWFIREEKTGGYLNGFSSWDRVEGALLHYLLTGPLHWFGIVNLARGSADGRFTAFQLVPQAQGLLRGELPATSVKESNLIKVKDTRLLIVPVGAPRALRYQIGRAGELIHTAMGESRYLLTVNSLNNAAEQGLFLQHLLQLIEKDQPGTAPDGLKRLAERWTQRGKEAGFERVLLLRFHNPAVCAEFIKAAGCRFKLEVLNPQTVLVKPSQQEGIRQLLAELGILTDDQVDV